MNYSFPIFDININDDGLGLTAISLVDYPAIETDFLAFNAEKTPIWCSQEKREIVSPILIPNQLILGKTNDGQYYYYRWTKDTIALAAEKYMKNGYFNNFTVMHPTKYNPNLKYSDVLEKDIYMLRMWIIDPPADKDDANTKYGFNLPEGTLMVHLKVHNRKIWNQVRQGVLRGLSIEAMAGLNEINQNKQDIEMEIYKKSILERLVQFMNSVSEEAKALVEEASKDKTESGVVSLKYYIDDDHYIEVDAEGFARDEEMNLVAEGKYLLADGNYLVVDENNKFVATEAETPEAKEEEAPVEAPIAEEKVKIEEEDEEKDKEDEGQAEPVADEPDTEGDAVGDEEVAGEPAEEAAEETFTFELDGVEYQLPQAVIDYINALIASKDEAFQTIEQMKNVTPSVEPLKPVINQSSESETPNLIDAIRRLNFKK